MPSAALAVKRAERQARICEIKRYPGKIKRGAKFPKGQWAEKAQGPSLALSCNAKGRTLRPAPWSFAA